MEILSYTLDTADFEGLVIGFFTCAVIVFGYLRMKESGIQKAKSNNSILKSDELEALGLMNADGDVYEIYVTKDKTERSKFAENLLKEGKEARKRDQKAIDTLQSKILADNESITSLKAKLNQHGSKLQGDIEIKTSLTNLINQITHDQSEFAATINSLAFEESKYRFLSQVSKGHTKNQAMDNLLTKSGALQEQETYLAEILTKNLDELALSTTDRAKYIDALSSEELIA